MTMVPNSDESEQRLLRLLALKRHETPPPGFFDRLPHRILINIRASTEMAERPWWQRIWNDIIQHPMVAGSYAALGVGALLFGISVLEVATDREADHPMFVGASLDSMVNASPTEAAFHPPVNVPSGAIYHVAPAMLQNAAGADFGWIQSVAPAPVEPR